MKIYTQVNLRVFRALDKSRNEPELENRRKAAATADGLDEGWDEEMD